MTLTTESAATAVAGQTPLSRMTAAFPQTALWNDSADPVQLSASIANGAVGATCNPVIAVAAIKADLPRWQARIAEIAAERPTAGESEIGWQVVEELSIEAARLLEPAFAASGGRNGRLSMQTDPRLHRDPEALVAQAVHFSGLAKNIIVKIPATAAGVIAMEEATFQGVAINATVSFTVAQVVAVAEAIERGLDRRAAAGLPEVELGSVATLMGGRLDDWLKVVAGRQNLLLTPGILDWAGVAALKKHRPYVVGFAAETNNVEEYAQQKRSRKNLDLICANDVSQSNQGFNSDNNALHLFWQDGEKRLPLASKSLLGQLLLDEIVTRYDEKNRR